MSEQITTAEEVDGALSTALRDMAYLTLGDDGISPEVARLLGIGDTDE